MDRPLDLNNSDERRAADLIAVTSVCQATSSLPRSGGVLEQDVYVMLGMQEVLRAQSQKQDRDIEAAKSKNRSR